MNKITFESKTQNPIIHIPPYDGMASFRLVYHHNLKKPKEGILKVQLTIEIQLVQEFTGNEVFSIMKMVYYYRVNIEDKLEIKDLTKIWFDCAAETIELFNVFERKQFGRQNPIAHESQKQLKDKVSPHIEWYNALP